MTQAEAIERFKQACATAILIGRPGDVPWCKHADYWAAKYLREHWPARDIRDVALTIEQANDHHLKLTTINQERRTP
jgi:hypothetical protein